MECLIILDIDQVMQSFMFKPIPSLIIDLQQWDKYLRNNYKQDMDLIIDFKKQIMLKDIPIPFTIGSTTSQA